jgi:uncharacterized protein (TIGR04255 family)
MAPSKHDTFKKPTVAEALCEIHFSSSDATFWQTDWRATLQAQAGSKFPNFERKEIRSFQAEIGPEGLKFADAPATVPRAIFKDHSNRLLMQVSPGLLAINEISEYRGWNDFSSDLKNAWDFIVKSAHPVGVHRIGLRYINKIPRTNSDDEVGQWLKSSAFVPDRLMAAKSRFLNRMEDGTDPNHRLVVTIAEAVEGEARPIIFDIDVFSETKLNADWSSIHSIVDRLHEEAWTVFSNAIGAKLKTALNGGVA